MTKQLPPITNKQLQIIQLIYRYRFLSTIQIQHLLNHQSKNRITNWLKTLVDNQYLERIYNPSDFISKTKPAIYYIGLNGIRKLSSLDNDNYPTHELRKRYKENTRKQDFTDTCRIIADCCITMHQQTTGKLGYDFAVQSDMLADSDYYKHLEDLQPDIYFTKNEPSKEATYLLNIFSSNTPRYMMNKKLKLYIEYLDDQPEDESRPIALFAYAETKDLIAAKRRTAFLLEDKSLEDELEEKIRFTTLEKIVNEGITGMIWEEL